MNPEIVDRVIELAADVFGASADELSPATSPDDIENWDSVAHLNLMVALEDEFSLQFSFEDVARAGTLEAIAELVATRST